jgi:hypothetical protein
MIAVSNKVMTAGERLRLNAFNASVKHLSWFSTVRCNNRYSGIFSPQDILAFRHKPRLIVWNADLECMEEKSSVLGVMPVLSTIRQIPDVAFAIANI